LHDNTHHEDEDVERAIQESLREQERLYDAAIMHPHPPLPSAAMMPPPAATMPPPAAMNTAVEQFTPAAALNNFEDETPLAIAETRDEAVAEKMMNNVELYCRVLWMV
jgi:hypothetical protein